MRANLLCAGTEPGLLHRRAEALAGRGFHAVTAVGEEETERLFRAGDFDAVVLCDSLRAERQVALASALLQMSPSTGIIALGAEAANPCADVTVCGTDLEALVVCCEAMFRPGVKAG